MIIAAAQFSPVHEGIKENLEVHYQYIEIAAKHGAGFIIFPEMSITGYLRETAALHSFTIADSRLETLQLLSDKYSLTIVGGAPVNIDGDLYIGSFVFTPFKKTEIYTKQYLHPGEERYFSSSFNYHPIFRLNSETVSLAICADIDHPKHANDAGKLGTTLYAASIFFSPNGLVGAYDSLSSSAKTNNMHVLMSNFCGHSWGSEAGGRSAFWDNKGELVDSLDDKSSGILLVSAVENGWETKSIVL